MADEELVAAHSGQQLLPSSADPLAGILQTPWASRIEDHPSWSVLSRLVVVLSAEVELKAFCVKDLLALQKGHIFETQWPETEDVPLMAGSIQLAWTEFEVVDDQLVVRLTRLA